MTDFKDGCKLIAETLVFCTAWIVIMLACICFVIGRAHGDEGPYTVGYTSSSFVGLTGLKVRSEDFAVVYSKERHHRAANCYSMEACADLAEAMNAAHARRGCKNPMDQCLDNYPKATPTDNAVGGKGF